MVRGKGFPRRAPAGSQTRRRHKGENKDGTGGGLGRVREGKGSGRARGPVRRIVGGGSAAGPGSGSSDHSSEPSVSAGAFAARAGRGQQARAAADRDEHGQDDRDDARAGDGERLGTVAVPVVRVGVHRGVLAQGAAGDGDLLEAFRLAGAPSTAWSPSVLPDWPPSWSVTGHSTSGVPVTLARSVWWPPSVTPLRVPVTVTDSPGLRTRVSQLAGVLMVLDLAQSGDGAVGGASGPWPGTTLPRRSSDRPCWCW